MIIRSRVQMFGYVQLRTVRFKKGGRKEGNTVTGSWIAYLSVELDRKRREIKGHLYPLYPRYLRDSIRSLSDIRVSFTSLNIFQSFFSPLSLSLLFFCPPIFFKYRTNERKTSRSTKFVESDEEKSRTRWSLSVDRLLASTD